MLLSCAERDCLLYVVWHGNTFGLSPSSWHHKNITIVRNTAIFTKTNRMELLYDTFVEAEFC